VTSSIRWARAGLVIAVTTETVLLAFAVHPGETHQLGILLREMGALAAFVAALSLLPRCAWSTSQLVKIVLGVGAGLQLLAVSHIPVSSDDDFRYAWDAKVQLAGIDPYQFAPTSPHLSFLRDHFLFPADLQPCPHGITGGCTWINLPDQHTIYPPVGQAAFVALRVLSFGGHGGHLPLQLAAAAGAVAIAALLAHRAVRTGGPLWTVAMWAWCPMTVMELGNNAHIDWLAVLLGLLAIGAAERRRPLAAGAWLGAAIVTKLYPVLLLPSVLRRRPPLVLGGMVAVIGVTYLPHVLAVRGDVVGYLPGYLHEDGYSTGRGYRLIGVVLPPLAAGIVAVLAVGAAMVWAAWRADPDYPDRSALVVVGVALLAATPSLPWYTLLLLALAARVGRPEWLGVVAAGTVSYLGAGAGAKLSVVGASAYGAGLVILLVGTWWRLSRAAGEGRPPEPAHSLIAPPGSHRWSAS
jgi:alpha-1,2-mannosyltransferase